MDKIECMKAAIESAKDSCEQVEMHLRWVETDIASLCDKIETSNLTDQQIGSELRALIYRRNDCAQCIKEYKEYIEATQRLLEKAQVELQKSKSKAEQRYFKPNDYVNEDVNALTRVLENAIKEILQECKVIEKIPEPIGLGLSPYRVVYTLEYNNKVVECYVSVYGKCYNRISDITFGTSCKAGTKHMTKSYTEKDIIKASDDFKKEMRVLWNWLTLDIVEYQNWLMRNSQEIR